MTSAYLISLLHIRRSIDNRRMRCNEGQASIDIRLSAKTSLNRIIKLVCAPSRQMICPNFGACASKSLSIERYTILSPGRERLEAQWVG